MANFDPAQRRETWIFVEIGQQPKGKKIYRCLNYVLVSYDSDPVQYLEPSPVDESVAVVVPDGSVSGKHGQVINPNTDGLGRIGDFLFVTRRPFEVFAYNDVDAASNIGQLPALTPGASPSFAG
jgi:hypothetical protein